MVELLLGTCDPSKSMSSCISLYSVAFSVAALLKLVEDPLTGLELVKTAISGGICKSALTVGPSTGPSGLDTPTLPELVGQEASF